MTEPMDNNAREQLMGYVERVLKLEEEKAQMMSDIKDVYQEVKSMGFDVPITRKIVALMKKDKDQLQEEDALLELYRAAVGV